jgi:hypothetical protein
MEKGLTKQRIFAELAKSSHGKLLEYVAIGQQAVATEGAFFQHLIAWNFKHGQIRDSKVALPVIGLAYENDLELLDNSVAHLAMLGPRELSKAFEFIREIRPKGKMSRLDRVIKAYLRQKESERHWDHIAIQHRGVLKALYAMSHTGPGNKRVAAVISGQWKEKVGETMIVTKLDLPKGSIFEAVARLKDMTPVEAAGAIIKYRIPFLIAMGALGVKAKEPDLVLALINQMSATELTTNVKMLEKLGIKTNPALRATFEEALKKASTSKQNTLKTTAAIEAIEDEGLKEKLRNVQAKQIAAAGGPEGNWLVLADKSGSMRDAIEISRHVSATLSQFVKGKVWLTFFDTVPMSIDVTGFSLDQIKKATAHIGAGGGTSIGCSLNRLLIEKTEVDGIAIISDGGEGAAPFFSDVYKKYAKMIDKDVPVYFYQLSGDPDYLSQRMQAAGIEMTTFDLRRGQVDYYSLPNMAQTMRSNQYSLVDEILSTPLVSLSDVLKNSEELVGV